MTKDVWQIVTTFDNSTVKGGVGLLIAIVAPWLDFLNQGVQLCAGMGGLVLLILGIIHKWYQIQESKKKLK